MRPVVDARHEEAEGQAGQDPAPGRLPQVRTAAAMAVVQHRPHEAEDRRGGADGQGGAVQEAREEGQERSRGRAGREADHARSDVDDDGAARAVEVRHRGTEVTHPHHVEHDVQHAAVQPGRAQGGPPAPKPEHGDGATGAEEEQARSAGRQEREEAAAADAGGIGGEGGQVERPAGPHHEGHEGIVELQAAHEGGQAEQARPPAAAPEALRVVDAHEHAAGGAQRRSLAPGEHVPSYARAAIIGSSALEPWPVRNPRPAAKSSRSPSRRPGVRSCSRSSSSTTTTRPWSSSCTSWRPSSTSPRPRPTGS